MAVVKTAKKSSEGLGPLLHQFSGTAFPAHGD